MSQFETGFDQPSLDNPRLFDLYAQRVRAQVAEVHAGYAFRLEKKDDPGNRRWILQFEKGWHSGVEIEIEPKRATPHRATVSVARHSRLSRVLLKMAMALYLAAAILILLAGWLVIRLGFLVILLFLCFFPYMLLAFLAVRVLEGLTGRNEITPPQRQELLERLRLVPLPQAL